jgi:hypothetical protein
VPVANSLEAVAEMSVHSPLSIFLIFIASLHRKPGSTGLWA